MLSSPRLRSRHPNFVKVICEGAETAVKIPCDLGLKLIALCFNTCLEPIIASKTGTMEEARKTEVLQDIDGNFARACDLSAKIRNKVQRLLEQSLGRSNPNAQVLDFP